MGTFINLRPSTTGNLFVFPDGCPVTVSYFTDILNRCLNVCGLSSLLYKPHSFRIGAATTAAANGHSETQIACMGRWKSDAFKKYIRIPSLSI